MSMNTGLGTSRVLPANLIYKQELSILPPLSLASVTASSVSISFLIFQDCKYIL